MPEDLLKTKMEKSNLLPAIIDQLTSVSKLQYKKILTPWEKVHKATLKNFLNIQKECQQNLEQLLTKDFQALDLWNEVKNVIKKLLDHADSLQYISSEYSAEKFLEDWQTQFDKTLAEITATHKIKVEKDFWLTQESDSFKTRLWKSYKRKRIGFSDGLLKVQNIFRKSPKPAPQIKRSIAVHNLLKYYYDLPLSRFWFDLWQKFLQHIAIQIDQMHQVTEKIIDELLFLEDLKDVCLNADREKISAKLQKVRDLLPKAEQYFAEIDSFKEEEAKKFKENLNDLKREFENKWSYAGTYILPEKRFSEKKYDEQRKNLHEKFDKNKSKWIKHFDGEREDWCKDFELSNLQSGTTQKYIDSIKIISQTINNHIIPTYKEPLDLLSESLKKYKNAAVKNETGFKNEILNEKKLMLRTLRYEKLPHTIDAVLHAQLLKPLDNYTLQIKNNISALPDQYRIFRTKDLKKIPPDSQFVDIPLKDLVFEEIYPDLLQGIENLKIDVQQKTDKIIRDISEIDQIVEFNLDAALELLEKNEKDKDLNRALNVVVEGFERAYNQLQSLVEQNRELADLSQEKLLQLTFDFESRIQELGDNEKIMALKLRVAKSKTREELRVYRSKAIGVVKSSLPTLIKFFSNSINNIQERYFRLRKITGLQPLSTDIEDKLSQFITNTEKQIATLPYVYQRLFRIQPLTDDRFFEGRQKDLKMLQQEFDSWRSGQFGITAVVGEKGSGKTTLLNFADQQIYNNMTLIKLQLAGKTISTEKELFLYLKDAFQEKEVNNFDELENKYISGDNPKIVFVEDIQNLFLRTVDSFGAIERFLLFISRTNEKIYWVITCTLYSWKYLDRVINIAKFFQQIVFLGGLTNADIEHIVLKRHRVSGYNILFEAGEEITNSKKFKKLTTEQDQQEYLKDYYFKQLNDLADGNISVTVMFWLGSIVRIEKDMMVINAEMNIDFSFLHQLPADELFTLAALLQHEMLNIDEHARVFNQDVQQSSLLLKQMANRKLLHEKSGNNYQINFLLYRAVVRTLTIKNILY